MRNRKSFTEPDTRQSPSPVSLSLDRITKMTARDARVLGALCRLGETVRRLGPTLSAIVERYSGSPVKLRVVLPVDPQDVVCQLPGPGFEGMAVRIRVVDPPSDALLMIPGTLCRVLTSSVLGTSKGSFAMDAVVQQAVLTHLVADVLRALPTFLPAARLHGVTAVSEDDGHMFGEQDTVLHLRVRAGAARDLVTLVMPEPRLIEAARAPWVARVLGPCSGAKNICLPVCVVMGGTWLTMDQVRGLEPSDIVILDDVAPGWPLAADEKEALCDLRIHGAGHDGFLVRARVRGSDLVVMMEDRSVLEGDMHSEQDRTTVDGSATDGEELTEPGLERVRQVQARVVVEVARTSLPVEQLLGLSSGTVIALDRPPSMEVTLTAQGRELAHGVLVQVEGELAVKVLKVLR